MHHDEARIEAIYDDEDPDHARELLLPEAEGGNPVAQFYVGQLCTEQSPRNDKAAVAWFRKSAASGYLPGIHMLASHLYFGFGTAQDIEAGVRLFREAAERGFDAAQWKLGQHLLARAETRTEALAWLRRAAGKGHGAARELLEEQGGNRTVTVATYRRVGPKSGS